MTVFPFWSSRNLFTLFPSLSLNTWLTCLFYSPLLPLEQTCQDSIRVEILCLERLWRRASHPKTFARYWLSLCSCFRGDFIIFLNDTQLTSSSPADSHIPTPWQRYNHDDSWEGEDAILLRRTFILEEPISVFLSVSAKGIPVSRKPPSSLVNWPPEWQESSSGNPQWLVWGEPWILIIQRQEK
jgi:hypothetical protein